MKTQQPTLFGLNAYGGLDGIDKEPIARARDPRSSHKAAEAQVEKGKIRSGAQIILNILQRAGPGRALTYREIWSAATDAEREKLREPNTVAKRLSVLAAKGLVVAGQERPCSVGKSEAREWCLFQP